MTGFGNGNIVSTPRKRAHVIFAFCRRRRSALNQINFTSVKQVLQTRRSCNHPIAYFGLVFDSKVATRLIAIYVGVSNFVNIAL
jgi:hypothetical protein